MRRSRGEAYEDGQRFSSPGCRGGEGDHPLPSAANARRSAWSKLLRSDPERRGTTRVTRSHRRRLRALDQRPPGLHPPAEFTSRPTGAPRARATMNSTGLLQAAPCPERLPCGRASQRRRERRARRSGPRGRWTRAPRGAPQVLDRRVDPDRLGGLSKPARRHHHRQPPDQVAQGAVGLAAGAGHHPRPEIGERRPLGREDARGLVATRRRLDWASSPSPPRSTTRPTPSRFTIRAKLPAATRSRSSKPAPPAMRGPGNRRRRLPRPRRPGSPGRRGHRPAARRPAAQLRRAERSRTRHRTGPEPASAAARRPPTKPVAPAINVHCGIGPSYPTRLPACGTGTNAGARPERSQRVPAQVDRAFDFYADAVNLEPMTPPCSTSTGDLRSDRDGSRDAARLPAAPARSPL